MTRASRADLLRLLRLADRNQQDLACAVGFRACGPMYKPEPFIEVETAEATGGGSVESGVATTIGVGVTEYEPEPEYEPELEFKPVEFATQRSLKIWTVRSCQAQAPAEPAPESAAIAFGNVQVHQRERVERHLPLRTAGQWQNLWDRALPQLRLGASIDLPRTRRLLSEAPGHCQSCHVDTSRVSIAT